MPTLAKRFQVKVVKDRKVMTTQYLPNPERKKDERATPFITKQVETVIPEGFMVFFPMGHSVFFETREQMVRAGVVESENFTIDLDTGEVHQEVKHIDLEKRSASRTMFSDASLGV
jgi:hypothetical protein